MSDRLFVFAIACGVALALSATAAFGFSFGHGVGYDDGWRDAWSLVPVEVRPPAPLVVDSGGGV